MHPAITAVFGGVTVRRELLAAAQRAQPRRSERSRAMPQWQCIRTWFILVFMALSKRQNNPCICHIAGSPVTNWQSCGLVFALIISPLQRTGALPAGELPCPAEMPRSIDRLSAYAAAATATQAQFKHTFQPPPPPSAPPPPPRITWKQAVGPWRRYCVNRPCAQTNGVSGVGLRLTVHAWLTHWWHREVCHGRRPLRPSLAADEEQHLKPSKRSMRTLTPNLYPLLSQQQQIYTIIYSMFVKWWISNSNLMPKVGTISAVQTTTILIIPEVTAMKKNKLSHANEPQVRNDKPEMVKEYRLKTSSSCITKK